MSTAHPRAVTVAGVGMHPWGKWGRSFVQYGVHAARQALGDAGVPWSDVDLVVGGETVRNGYAGYVAGSTFAQALGPWYRECVDWHGLGGRCASIRMLNGAFRSISDVQCEKADLLVDLAMQAIEQDGADVIVLAGAPLSGLAPMVRDRIPVPVVDCAQAALRHAATLAALRPVGPQKGSFARPAAKASVGVITPG